MLAQNLGSGRGGIVRINATDLIKVMGGNGEISSINVVSGSAASGRPGDIQIRTRDLILRNGGQIIATTFGRVDASDIQIRAQNLIKVIGILSERTAQSGIFAASYPLFQETSGRGGSISIYTRDLQLMEGAEISASALGQADAGDIFIRGSNSVEADRSTISTVLAQSAIGSGGSIEIQAGEMQLRDSKITAQSRGRGNAGAVTLRVDEQLSASDSSITTSTTRRQTQGGDVEIRAEEVVLGDRTQVSAENRGRRGQAGDVSLFVSDRVQLTDSDITTQALRSTGGDISINAARGRDGAVTLSDQGIVLLEGDSDITTNSQGDGGNIAIGGAGILAFDDSDIISRSAAQRGGDITLTSLFSETIPPGSEIEDSNGQVDLNADGEEQQGRVDITDTTFVENSLTTLSDTSVDPEQLLANSCIARDRESGTFTVIGTGGLPDRPGDGSLSPYPTGDVRSLPETPQPQDNSWQPGDPIVEPQGVYQLADGRLVLSRECSP